MLVHAAAAETHIILQAAQQVDDPFIFSKRPLKKKYTALLLFLLVLSAGAVFLEKEEPKIFKRNAG